MIAFQAIAKFMKLDIYFSFESTLFYIINRKIHACIIFYVFHIAQFSLHCKKIEVEPHSDSLDNSIVKTKS